MNSAPAVQAAEPVWPQSDWRCADEADRRQDGMVGTAPPAPRWFLIEHQGGWPRDAAAGLGELGLPVAEAAAKLGARVTLIRRHGRRGRGHDGEPRRWGLADARMGRESLRWGRLDDDRQLLEVLAAAAAGEEPGEPDPEPAYLVCTHAQHDVCCAVRGRPAAEWLSRHHPDRTWECSHTGGERFAPNVVVLPHGLIYGRAYPVAVRRIVAAHAEGRVVPELLRGRSSVTMQVQAAQALVRRERGSPPERLGVDALRPYRLQREGEGLFTVGLIDADGNRIERRIRQYAHRLDTPSTCAGNAPTPVWAFEVVGDDE